MQQGCYSLTWGCGTDTCREHRPRTAGESAPQKVLEGAELLPDPQQQGPGTRPSGTRATAACGKAPWGTPSHHFYWMCYISTVFRTFDKGRFILQPMPLLATCLHAKPHTENHFRSKYNFRLCGHHKYKALCSLLLARIKHQEWSNLFHNSFSGFCFRCIA